MGVFMCHEDSFRVIGVKAIGGPMKNQDFWTGVASEHQIQVAIMIKVGATATVGEISG